MKGVSSRETMALRAPWSTVTCCWVSVSIQSSCSFCLWQRNRRLILRHAAFGFTTPPMSNIYTPMEGSIPNIIQLPFGKSPPLHIQAPSWKHLLKLLTRLDCSRIEPTVEALATFKFEMRLRTVIQFMKVRIALPKPVLEPMFTQSF